MLVRLGNFLFRYRNVVFPAAFALVFAPGPRIANDPAVALAAGAVLAFAGQALRAMTIGLKYIVRGGRDRRVFAEGLVTDGVFAHTRNPMYLGNLLILSGIALASNSWTCAVVGVPLAVLVYASIIAAEEHFLREKFWTAWREYAASVPRWGLKPRGLATLILRTPFHWRRLLVKEYGTTTALILALGVIGWLAFDDEQARLQHPAARPALLVVMAAASIGWMVARWLKKSRHLIAD